MRLVPFLPHFARRALTKQYTAAALLGFLVACVPAAAQTTVNLSASKDNTLFEDPNGALSDGAGPNLFSGTTNNGSIRRALVAFDLSAIPPGSTITSVTLTLHLSKTSSGATTVTLHRVLADWGEGTSNSSGVGGGGQGAPATTNDATWKHRFFDTKLWANLGGDFASTASANQSVNGIASYTWGSTTQMVADVQGWVNDPTTNFGWILIGDESTAPTSKRFDSRQNATTSVRPKLTVTYTSSATLSGTITLQDCSDAAVPLTFEFRPTDGSAAFTRTVTPASSGLFSVSGLAHKNYTVHIKGTKWLAQNVAANASGGDVTGVNVTLPGGDADNSNTVDFDDLTILAIAYNTALGDGSGLYDDRADFNRDNQVEFADLTILAINYNLSGDP